MLEVRDGSRTLQFEGALLGQSTSWRRGSTRWIEFKLYKTESGSYILSRIGVSLVYHGAACALVPTYNLKEIPFYEMNTDALPCERCNPDESAELIFPEKDRYWAQVSDNAGAVLEALYKYDEFGSRYLTSVAKRLMESAGKVDKNIFSIYKTETIK